MMSLFASLMKGAKSKTRLVAVVMALLAYLKATGKVSLTPDQEKMIGELLLAAGLFGLRDAADKILALVVKAKA